MFGKVAKGLLHGRHRQGNEIEVEVEVLLSRAADGVLPRDRAEALSLLSELVQENDQARRILGMTGLPVLQAVLREDQEDNDLVRGALECLSHAVALSMDGERRNIGTTNAELFCREEENLGLVFKTLGTQKDFYIRYYAVQLLTALSSVACKRLVQASLKEAGAVTMLMDLLSDGQEVIRNEALLLMVGLTRASPDIKRIAAYEGAFENQLGIIRGEGGIEGGIVVQDCLDLLNNLLRDSPGNQLLFRESGFLKQLIGLLKVSEDFSSRSQTRQRVANMMSLLDTFIVLTQQISDTHPAQDQEQANSERLKNCDLLLSLELMSCLLMLALKGNETSLQAVRKQALLCIAHFISGFKKGQERLVMSGLGWLKGIPALRQILKICLYSQDPSEHAAARSVIWAFCAENPDGQSMLAATLIPSTDQDSENTTFGGEIVKALNQPDLMLRSRGAAVLICMLDGNKVVKERLLQLPLSLTSRSPEALLMPQCVANLSQATESSGQQASYISIVLLRLFNAWVTDCHKATKQLLSSQSNLALIQDIVGGKKATSSNTVSGLAALLLGTCLVTEQTNGKETGILDLITTRIGLNQFFQKLNELYQDPFFKAAENGPVVNRPALRTGSNQKSEESGSENSLETDLAKNPFDHAFVKWAKSLQPQIRDALIGTEGTGTSNSSPPRFVADNEKPESIQLQEAVALIEKLERELESLKSRNRALTQQAIDLQRPTDSDNARQFPSTTRQMLPVSTPPSNNGPSQEEFRNQTLALEAAERRLAHGEDELHRLKAENTTLKGQLQGGESKESEWQKRLDAQERDLENVKSQLRMAERDKEEASAAAQKFEADLQALSQAYSDLEVHAHSLETRQNPEGSVQNDNGEGKQEVEEESTLDDLLACLAEEEQKVERLGQKLQELGIDPQSLIFDIGQQAETDDFT